jgi:hypothetical protein
MISLRIMIIGSNKQFVKDSTKTGGGILALLIIAAVRAGDEVVVVLAKNADEVAQVTDEAVSLADDIPLLDPPNAITLVQNEGIKALWFLVFISIIIIFVASHRSSELDQQSQRGDQLGNSIGTQGLIHGTTAFAVGYGLLLVIKGSEIAYDFQVRFRRGVREGGTNIAQLQSMGLELPEIWKITGMAYHGVHNADFTWRVTSGGEEIASQTLGGGFYGGTISWAIPIVVSVDHIGLE